MPNFSYQGTNRSNQTAVSGQLDAADIEAARARLRLMGIQADRLEPLETVAPAADLQFLSRRKSPPPPPPAELDFPELPAQTDRPLHLRALLTRKELLLPLGLVGLGLIWGAVSSLSGAATPAAPGSARSSHHFQLVVQGQVVKGPDGLPPGLLLSLHFPEIPLDLARTGPELALGLDGKYRVKFELDLPRTPSQLWVTLSAPGRKSVSLRGISLAGDPLTAEVRTVSLSKQ